MSNETDKKNAKESAIGCLIFIVIGGILFVSCSSDESETPEQKAERMCKDEISARVMAQSFIKDRLKAPSTAEFSGYGETKTLYLGDCTHQVIGYVDSQNSFGAQIRTHYSATVKNSKGTENWNLIDLTTE